MKFPTIAVYLQILNFIANMPPQESENLSYVEIPLKITDLKNLNVFLEQEVKKNMHEIPEGQRRTIVISMHPDSNINIYGKKMMPHPVILHFYKENNKTYIYLDDSQDSRAFDFYKNQLTEICAKLDAQFFARDFGEHDSYAIFHGKYRSQFGVLHILKLWAQDPIKMQNQFPNCH